MAPGTTAFDRARRATIGARHVDQPRRLRSPYKAITAVPARPGTNGATHRAERNERLEANRERLLQRVQRVVDRFVSRRQRTVSGRLTDSIFAQLRVQ